VFDLRELLLLLLVVVVVMVVFVRDFENMIGTVEQ
jgi:hypothetical protein